MVDFCINGGGMVGAALALGLAQQHYKVVVIEPHLPKPFHHGDGPVTMYKCVGRPEPPGACNPHLDMRRSGSRGSLDKKGI